MFRNENDDKENQNLSEVSKGISFPSPNPKEKTEPEDSNNVKHIKVEKKILWLGGDKILCLHTIKKEVLKLRNIFITYHHLVQIWKHKYLIRYSLNNCLLKKFALCYGKFTI